jgi:hypothetical protein
MLGVMRRHNLSVQSQPARVRAVKLLYQMKAMCDMVLLKNKD